MTRAKGLFPTEVVIPSAGYLAARAARASSLSRARNLSDKARRSMLAGFDRVARHFAAKARDILRPMPNGRRELRLWQEAGYVLVGCRDWFRGAR